MDRDGTQPPIDEQTARAAVLQAAAALGLPSAELGAAAVDTQIAGAAPINPQQTNQGPVSVAMYRIVTLPRHVATANGMVPVYGSRLRAAVNRYGEIQRVQTRFPPFALAAGLKLRGRPEVVDAVLEEIMRRQPEQDIEVEAQVA